MLHNNNTTTYRTRGAGENKIVCLHGAGCNSLHWSKIDPPEGWQIIAVDLPGHGLTPEKPLDDINDYALWVKTFLTTLGQKVLLAGHSMGGAITLTVAHQYPEYLSGLVLACTGASLRVSPQVLDLCRAADPAGINRFLAKYAYSGNISQEQIAQWQKELGTPQSSVYLAGFTACNNFDYRDKLRDISHPALVISAAQDRMTPPEYAKFLCTQLPCAELAEIEGSGHMAIIEQPRHFSEILADHCRQKL